MNAHTEFLKQYVLNRCIGKDGSLDGAIVAESAEKAWSRIQELSGADDQHAIVGGIENENNELKKHAAFLECKVATLINEKTAIILRYGELAEELRESDKALEAVNLERNKLVMSAPNPALENVLAKLRFISMHHGDSGSPDNTLIYGVHRLGAYDVALDVGDLRRWIESEGK